MNNTLVEINNTTLGIKEFHGQRVITFKDIDRVHERPDGTARRNFTSNKKHLIENEDYFKINRNIPLDEIRSLNITIPPKGTTLITESGYLLLVKSFTDDLAWQVQRQLVSNYFKFKDVSEKKSRIEEKLISLLDSMDRRLSKLEECQTQVQKSLPKKRFSYWSSKMFPKYQLLMDHFGIDKNKDLYKQLYREFHNTYPDIEINQIVDDYCYENKLDSCFTLDAIEHDKTVRKLFESMVDGLLEKYDLGLENVVVKEKTIFDN